MWRVPLRIPANVTPHSPSSLLPSFTLLPPSTLTVLVTFFFLFSLFLGPLVPLAPRTSHRQSPGLLVRTLVESRIAAPNARAHIKRTPTRAFTRSSGPAPRNNNCKCATLAETYLVTVGDKFAGSSGVRRAANVRACSWHARTRNHAFSSEWKRKTESPMAFSFLSQIVRFIRSPGSLIPQKTPTNSYGFDRSNLMPDLSLTWDTVRPRYCIFILRYIWSLIKFSESNCAIRCCSGTTQCHLGLSLTIRIRFREESWWQIETIFYMGLRQ